MRIHLLSTINSDYVVPFLVMAHSLRRCRLATTPITWHVCESDLSAEDRLTIQTHLESSAIEINWHRVADERLVELPIWGRAVAGMYQRVLVPDVLPESIKRMIYLDCDLLFLDAIEILWNTDITGSTIGAVQDAVIPYVSSPLGLRRYSELGFQRADPYFNAGVYIIDLDAWREHRVGEKAIDYVHRYERSINMADQDALNAVMHNRWKRLHDRWNIIGGSAGRAHFTPRGIDPSLMTDALRKPAIIHFAGYLKPWIYRGLGSIWSGAYTDALFQVFPDYRFERTWKTLSISFYDRHLRTYLYPLERLVWRTTRHLG